MAVISYNNKGFMPDLNFGDDEYEHYMRLVGYYSDDAWTTDRLREVLQSIWGQEEEREGPSSYLRRRHIIAHFALIQMRKKLNVSPLIDTDVHGHTDSSDTKTLSAAQLSLVPHLAAINYNNGSGSGSHMTMGVKRKDVSSQPSRDAQSAAKKAKTTVPLVPSTNSSNGHDDSHMNVNSNDMSNGDRYNELCTWSMNDDYRHTISMAHHYLSEHQLRVIHGIAANKCHDPYIIIDYFPLRNRRPRHLPPPSVDYKVPLLYSVSNAIIQPYPQRSRYLPYPPRTTNTITYVDGPSNVTAPQQQLINIDRPSLVPLLLSHDRYGDEPRSKMKVSHCIAQALQCPRPNVLRRAWLSCRDECVWRQLIDDPIRAMCYVSYGRILLETDRYAILWSPLTLPPRPSSSSPSSHVCHDGNGNGTVIWLISISWHFPFSRAITSLINNDLWRHHDENGNNQLYCMYDGQQITLMDMDGHTMIGKWEQPSISRDGRTLTIWSSPTKEQRDDIDKVIPHVYDDSTYYMGYSFDISSIIPHHDRLSSSLPSASTSGALSLRARERIYLYGRSYGRVESFHNDNDHSRQYWLMTWNGLLSLHRHQTHPRPPTASDEKKNHATSVAIEAAAAALATRASSSKSAAAATSVDATSSGGAINDAIPMLYNHPGGILSITLAQNVTVYHGSGYGDDHDRVLTYSPPTKPVTTTAATTTTRGTGNGPQNGNGNDGKKHRSKSDRNGTISHSGELHLHSLMTLLNPLKNQHVPLHRWSISPLNPATRVPWTWINHHTFAISNNNGNEVRIYDTLQPLSPVTIRCRVDAIHSFPLSYQWKYDFIITTMMALLYPSVTSRSTVSDMIVSQPSTPTYRSSSSSIDSSNKGNSNRHSGNGISDNESDYEHRLSSSSSLSSSSRIGSLLTPSLYPAHDDHASGTRASRSSSTNINDSDVSRASTLSSSSGRKGALLFDIALLIIEYGLCQPFTIDPPPLLPPVDDDDNDDESDRW